MTESLAKHYDDRYFAWQAPIGEFGGWANLTKFQAHVRETDDVLDFGCGGGFLLKNMRCRKKVGVEPNPSARATAQANGIESYSKTEYVPDGYADVIVSNNALEHTLAPLQELTALHPKLKRGGKIVFVVPCESITHAYRPRDVNHHLYSWSPMCLGNLFTEAGYTLIESKPYIHKWPPRYRLIARLGGRPLFEAACRIYGRLERSWFQVRAVGRRPE
ncbi:MAG TPA: class I SAM-dependent methyltransferase [Opitutaceae bacterium]|nr:class I SAM-dependent methyltransferase [Opitutaceae bacterium]